jgi:hypothetical protein
MNEHISYQVVYVGRDSITHVSPQRFPGEEEAREYLDTGIIGSGLIIKVFSDTGDVFAVSVVGSDGGEDRYMPEGAR